MGCENELEQLIAQEQEAEKSFQTSGNKHLFKYINIYNLISQRYTGPKRGRKQRETGIKHGCEELKKRNAGTEDY